MSEVSASLVASGVRCPFGEIDPHCLSTCDDYYYFALAFVPLSLTCSQAAQCGKMLENSFGLLAWLALSVWNFLAFCFRYEISRLMRFVYCSYCCYRVIRDWYVTVIAFDYCEFFLLIFQKKILQGWQSAGVPPIATVPSGERKSRRSCRRNHYKSFRSVMPIVSLTENLYFPIFYRHRHRFSVG